MSHALDRLREHVLPVAKAHAAAVDRDSRFPQETFDALKAQRLMGALIPTSHGGEGLSLTQVADLCSTLAQACGSSALIYAMHFIKVSSLVSHGAGSPWHEAFMARVATEQLLLGSATTEGGVGGDLRSSICAVQRSGQGEQETFTLEKDATVISYGSQSDAILITARKDANAPASDQVMVVAERHQMTLTCTGGWDTFGMRGTCSEGFALRVNDAPACQIFPLPFADIAAQSMLGTTHILWASVWYGLATEAASRAQALVRADMRRRNASGQAGAAASPALARLAELATALQAMRGGIMGAIERLERAHADPAQLETVGFLMDMNTLKVNASQAVVDILNRCMLICGIHGYRNDTPHSLGRLMRDAHSAPIMINNDRILTNMANLVLMNRFGGQLVG
jgi:acyl-CoA dehydrogenase